MWPAWIDTADVLAHVGGKTTTPADLATYAAAAAAYVASRRPDLDLEQLDGIPHDVRLAAALLTARLYARRGTALGTQNYGDFVGGLVRNDPDILRMLQVGPYATPELS